MSGLTDNGPVMLPIFLKQIMKSLVVSEEAEEDEKNIDCAGGDVSAGFGIEVCLD